MATKITSLGYEMLLGPDSVTRVASLNIEFIGQNDSRDTTVVTGMNAEYIGINQPEGTQRVTMMVLEYLAGPLRVIEIDGDLEPIDPFTGEPTSTDVPDDGGIVIRANGSFPVNGPVRVRLEHADGTVRYCYSGVIGQGYDILLTGGDSSIEFIAAPMPLGNVDVIFVDTDTGRETLVEDGLVFVHRTYSSTLISLRHVGGATVRALGPRDPLSED